MIESVAAHGGNTAVIKSHHNVGGLPDDLEMELVEPLRELFKDEVRAIGRFLGLADSIALRQPFPGPGLAVRILGEVTAERVALLQKADHIVTTEIEAAGEHVGLWQYFAVLLPVQSVGVMGDQRTYENACALRVVESSDGMTADWGPPVPRPAPADLQPHHQPGARDQPRRPRHQLQAPRDDRVGVSRAPLAPEISSRPARNFPSLGAN